MVLYTPESRPLLLNVKYIFERTPYLYTVLHVPGGERISRMEAHDILDFRSQSLRNYEIYFRFRLREISITRIQPFCIFSSVPIPPKVVTGVIWGHRSYRLGLGLGRFSYHQTNRTESELTVDWCHQKRLGS